MPIDLTIPAHHNCPRFQKCNLNKCPLDKNYFKLKNDPSDYSQIYKEKCVTKSIRKRIALAFNLKNRGLTQREQTSQKNWDNLPESVKQDRINKLKSLSPVSRCLAKNLVVTPKKKKRVENPLANEIKTRKNEQFDGGSD